jgi:hypothetical protein
MCSAKKAPADPEISLIPCSGYRKHQEVFIFVVHRTVPVFVHRNLIAVGSLWP